MPTLRQRKTVDKLVEYGGQGKIVSKGRILKEVGYSQPMIDTPAKVFESKGFLQVCDEAGLTEDFLTKALYDDIKTKKGKRKPELELAFRIRGNLKDDPFGKQQNNFFFINEEQQQQIARRYLTGNQPSES